MAKTVSTTTAPAKALRIRSRQHFLLDQIFSFRFHPYRIIKRGADFVIAAVGILLLIPLFVAAAIAIRIDSPGPIFFRQKRTGRNGKEFDILKFRTMTKDNDMHDNNRDDKSTRVGRFLRDTSIDELPQLINILRGEMSFIGPRPWVPEYYQNMNARQRNRYKVLPGLTGLAQIKGRNGISVFKKINYDLDYVKNYSFSHDLSIIWDTIVVVISRRGASAGKQTIRQELAALKAKNGK